MRAFLETLRARLTVVAAKATDLGVVAETTAILEAIDAQLSVAIENDRLAVQVSSLQADVNLCLDALREMGSGAQWAVREITGEDAAKQTTTDLPALAERVLRIG